MSKPTTPSESGHHTGPDQQPTTDSQPANAQPPNPPAPVPAPTPAPARRHPRTSQRPTRERYRPRHRAGINHQAAARAATGSGAWRRQPDSTLTGAPDPEGDVVPGNPPVPITVWYLPKPRRGTGVRAGLVRRLVANYTHPGSVVINLIAGHRLGTRNRPPAALIITSWPQTRTGPDNRPDEHIAACVEHLDEGGCLAVVVTNHDIPDALGALVGAARSTGLRYLQHVVVAHHLTPRRNHEPSSPVSPARKAPVPASAPAAAQGRQLRVHTDLLLFIKHIARA
jgi:hypothetical protein